MKLIVYGSANEYTGTTASDGTYSVDVALGTYLLFLYDPLGAHVGGYYSATGFQADYHDATELIVAANVTGIDIQLPNPIWIKGKVTAAGGAGIGQITVGAYNLSTDNGGNAVTADDGTWQIAVTPGTYIVGYSDDAGVYASGYYALTGYTASGASAADVVVEASDVSGIDVELPLAIHIKGTVTSPANAPVPNVEVVIFGDTYVGIGKTSGDGTYSVVAVADSYQVGFADAANTYPFGYYSTTGFQADPDKATLVVVGTTDVTGINIKFPTPVYLRGQVTDAGANPLAGIKVTAYGAIYDGGALTAADGRYAIPVVADSYKIRFTDGNDFYETGFYSATGFQWDQSNATAVKVTTASVGSLNVQMPVAAHITGTITGPGDVPLANMEIVAYGPYGSHLALTGADGTYTVTASHGSYHLGVYDPHGVYVEGYYTTNAASGHFTVDSTAASPIAVAAIDVPNINVKLPTPLHIQGRVTAAGNVPLKGISVSAYSSVLSVDGTTDADGKFSLTVVADTYHVSYCDMMGVYGSGYYSAGGLVTNELAASPVTLTNADQTGIDVELPPAVHITGTVTGTGDVPLAGIDVAVINFSTFSMIDAATGADGKYSVIVSPGTYLMGFQDEQNAYQQGYYSDGGFTPDQDSATPITVTNADVPNIDVKMLPLVKATAHITALPTWAASTSIKVKWSATQGTYPIDSYSVRYRRAAWNGAFGSYVSWQPETYATSATLTGVAGYTYCFSSRATDYNFIDSDWSAETCTSVPLDDRSLKRSSGWSLKTGSAYYKSTYVTTTKVGAKLYATKVTAQRIALVVTTCSTCGSVKVYWGSTLLKTISLKTSSTHNKVLVTVVTWSAPKTGTLYIKVASSGKKVIIDGVAIRAN
jgi:hypothetical protein